MRKPITDKINFDPPITSRKEMLKRKADYRVLLAPSMLHNSAVLGTKIGSFPKEIKK